MDLETQTNNPGDVIALQYGGPGSQLSALHCPKQRKQELGDLGLWCRESWEKNL